MVPFLVSSVNQLQSGADSFLLGVAGPGQGSWKHLNPWSLLGVLEHGEGRK